MSPVAEVTEDAFGFMFEFLGPVGDVIEGAASGTAEYLLVFEASQPCT